ncbi:MAG: hypothetical protein VXW65_00360 [Pseudomonadota bacterium]|nr:hypothetical protein [Pseudomonadota bacterium]
MTTINPHLNRTHLTFQNGHKTVVYSAAHPISLPLAQSHVSGLPAALSALSATDADLQTQVSQKLDASAYNPYWQGKHNSVFELETAKPPELAKAGDYAYVDWGEVGLVQYVIDTTLLMWRPVTTTVGTTTDEIDEGNINRYFDEQRVRDTVLGDGLSTSDSAPVVSTDLLLAAIGKLQAQMNAITASAKTEEPYFSQRWYANRLSAGGGTTNLSASLEILIPLPIFLQDIMLSSLQVRVLNSGTGREMRYRIYKVSAVAATGYVVDAVTVVGTQTVDAAGFYELLDSAMLFDRNARYFIGIAVNSSTQFRNVALNCAMILSGSSVLSAGFCFLQKNRAYSGTFTTDQIDTQSATEVSGSPIELYFQIA